MHQPNIYCQSLTFVSTHDSELFSIWIKKHVAHLSLEESPWITKTGPAKWPNNGGFGGVGGFLFPKT
jgi:hypothetical protein